jgi:hypothetical protein
MPRSRTGGVDPARRLAGLPMRRKLRLMGNLLPLSRTQLFPASDGAEHELRREPRGGVAGTDRLRLAPWPRADWDFPRHNGDGPKAERWSPPGWSGVSAPAAVTIVRDGQLPMTCAAA